MGERKREREREKERENVIPTLLLHVMGSGIA